MTDPKATGLIGGIEKRNIEIVDYDRLWPAKFQAHAAAIANVLGDAALQIEHSVQLQCLRWLPRR